MDRRLLFPAAAVTAWAQVVSPEAAEAEKALRARVNEFYQLQVDKKFRQADAYVAEDTKDWYFASGKPDLQGFSIVKVELLEGNTRAKVTIKTKSTMLMMGVGRMPIEIPTVVTWKIENGQWMWYFDSKAPIETPFGPIQPKQGGADSGGAMSAMMISPKDIDIKNFLKQVTIDKTSVALWPDKKTDTVVISNAMPGFVDIAIENKIPGLKVEIDNAHVPAAGKASLLFSRTADGKESGVVHVTVAPLNTMFDIRIQME